jgi:hypothetical protein
MGPGLHQFAACFGGAVIQRARAERVLRRARPLQLPRTTHARGSARFLFRRGSSRPRMALFLRCRMSRLVSSRLGRSCFRRARSCRRHSRRIGGRSRSRPGRCLGQSAARRTPDGKYHKRDRADQLIHPRLLGRIFGLPLARSDDRENVSRHAGYAGERRLDNTTNWAGCERLSQIWTPDRTNRTGMR